MSKLEELIQQLCPDGVEWKTLNDIGEFFGGLTGKSKNDFIDGNAAFITYSNIYSNPSLNLIIDEKVRIDDGEKQNVIQYGDILFTGSSETPEECGMSSVVTKEPTENMYLNSFCFGLRLFELDKFNFDYLKHLFRSTEIRKEICKTANGVTRFNVSKKKMGEIAIPLPPLPVQEEIVRLLDQLTETTQKYQAELEAELATRKKQYEEYRNQLLTFDATRTDVERTKISDICLNICSGGTPSTSHEEYYHGNIPWLRTQEVDWKEINDTEIKITDDAIANSSAKIIPANCVIVAMYGATAAKAAINKIPLSTNQACCNLEIDSNKALYRYVYQWFCKEYDKLKAMGEGSQNNINGKKVKDYPISFPPLTEQERIVNILDRMDKTHKELCQSIETEIKMRKQQYEYYRNQLLDFKKKEE